MPGLVNVPKEPHPFHFFVMEFVTGGDLHQAILAARLTIDERIRIILKVGDALTFAHQQGVIHRDVKPGNILLDSAGRPKLTDFDLVRAADTTGGTRLGLGSFLYAAPEAMQNAKEAAEPADVFGLGMTAIFALNGADLPPHVLRDPKEFAASLMVGMSCRNVLQRAVAWEVMDRWGSVAEFCEALTLAEANPELSLDVDESHSEARYLGNPSLSHDVQLKIREVFAQTLNLLGQHRYQEALAGCEFILGLDPEFQPAQDLIRNQDPRRHNNDPPAPEAPEEIDWSPEEIDWSPEEIDSIADTSEEELPVSLEYDLLAEARVFAMYGLHDKAEVRLRELIGMRPEHLEGLALLA